jgi:flavin-dependent dehydrogenase
MIGDAAGLADPISANGIGHSMISGRLADQKAMECIAKNDFSAAMTADYSERVHLRLRESLKIGRIAFLFFGLPPSFILKILNIATWFSDNAAIHELMFSTSIWKTLIQPSFYKKLIFKHR